MPSSESSSSSSSESSAPSSPEAQKKTNKSPVGTLETSERASKSTTEKHKESDASGPSKKVSKSSAGSPGASEKVLKSPKEKHKEPNTSGSLKKVSKSPSSSPEASKKILKSPKEGRKESNSSHSLKKLRQSPSKSHETPKKVLKSPTEESKQGSSHEESKKVLAPAKGSTEVQKVSTSPLDPAIPSRGRPHAASFKSSLQVLLKKQEHELEKSINYKEKIEREELDEEEEGEKGDEDERGRRGSEENTVEEKEKKKNKDGDKREAKGAEAKDTSKKMKQKEDEDIKEKSKKKENTKEEGRGKKSERKTEEEQGEKKSVKKHKWTPKGERRSSEDKTNITERGKGERKDEKGEKQTERREKAEVEEQDDKEEEIKITDKGEKSKRSTKREKTQKEEKETKRKEETMEVKTKKEGRMVREAEEKEEKERKRKKEEAREVEARKEEKLKKEEKEESLKVKKGTKEEKAHGSLYMKKKRTFNPWKEYYFVLDGLLLTYYRSQQQYAHLSGMKGSLDLSLVEEVHPRKPGLMKTHHPFCLARRNLPSIRLAAATKEDQQRWMDVLREVIRPHRISSHSSDKTLHTAAASAAATADPVSVCKAATLPARVKGIGSCSSSVSEDDEEENEEEEVRKEEVKKEEEPELIQPKKVPKVPIGVPLAKVNLGEVKLKKLEKREVKRDDGEKTAAAAAAAHDTTQDDTRDTTPPGELFGVVLKTRRREEKKGEEEKEALKDTTTTTTTTTTPARRPSKQPVIPLNSGKLLVVPETKSPKTSPATQKRQTPERRKSPSPSLPISKSVQALTKSAEEVKPTQVDVTSSEPSSSAPTTTLTSATAGKGKAATVKLCHAQTSEVKYSNVEAMDVEEEVVEVQAARREDEETEEKDVTKEDVKEVKATRRDVEAVRRDTTKEKEEGGKWKKEEVNATRRDVESEKKDVTDKEDEAQEAGKDTQKERKTREENTVAVGDEQRHKEDDDATAKARHQDLRMDIEDEDAAPANLKYSKGMQEWEEKLNKEFQQLRDAKVLSEAPAEDRQREDNSEGAATPPPETLSPPPPVTPPASPASSQASADSDKSSSPSSPVPRPSKSSSSSTKSSASSPKSFPSSPESLPCSPKSLPSSTKSSPSLPQSPPLSPESRDCEAETQTNVHAAKGPPQQEEEGKKVEEGVEEGPWDARRLRTNTNESTASSSTEGGEKKLGKFRRLKEKLKSGASHKKKEEPSSPKEPKKRRGSNALSVLLAGRKNEDKMSAEEPQPHASQEEATSESPTAPHHTVTEAPRHAVTTSPEPPPAEVSRLPSLGLPRVDLQEVDPAPPQLAEDGLLAPVDRLPGGQPSTEDAAAPRVTPPPRGEACHDTHRHFSVGSCSDPPPSIPEKTRMRARSPNYDVPKSNRPVTMLHPMDMGDEDKDEDEEEASQIVDGYLTEEQIEALLNAKENKGKRKQSRSRTQLLAVPDAVKGASLPAATPLPSSEDWHLKRPSFNSFSSIESDESLPVTNFLGVQRSSSSSGSLRDFRRSLEADADEHTSLTASESGESLSPDAEAPAEPQRRAPRPTDAITAKNRLSLTSPEFTVQEEEGLSSPETAKARPPCQGDDGDDGGDDKRKQKNGDDTKAKTEAGTKAEAEAEADSEAEQEDFFPVVGRDVQLRQLKNHPAAALDLPEGELRMSGIVSLKEYLRAQGEEGKDLEGVKSGISRLGHSAAVEKLKQASNEQ